MSPDREDGINDHYISWFENLNVVQALKLNEVFEYYEVSKRAGAPFMKSYGKCEFTERMF
jgi:hypothetical protein